MTITVTPRPYLLTFAASGHTYRLSSEETQRLLDNYPAVSATPRRVVLRGDDGNLSVIRPATRDSLPAFTLTASPDISH
jgi:hypothetical protein